MALIRIMIDGYSMLHACTEVAPGKPRHSEAARDELVYWLTRYQDAIGTPITIVFDGGRAPAGTPKAASRPELEILFSKAGQTADDLIERATQRLLAYGEVIVVTDDYAERETVLSLGAMTSSCEAFLRNIQCTLHDLARDLEVYNRRERQRFNKPRR